MAKRTDPKTVKAILEASYDSRYYESVLKARNYAFGIKDEASATPSQGGMFPYFPTTVWDVQAIGQSRRIWNAQFIGLASVMARVPEPKFPDIDQWTGETLNQFVMERVRGNYLTEGCWTEERERAFEDGDGFGCGFLQIVLKDDSQGNQYVGVEHHPLTQVLWDPYQASIGRSRHITFAKMLDVETASDLFGNDIVKRYRTPLFQDGGTSTVAEVVRIFEYFDAGIGGGKPTMMIIPGDICNAPIAGSIADNTFGCLPFSYYLHWTPPGARRPVGRIALQMGGQEAINEIEGRLRSNAKSPGFDIVDANQLNEDDLRLYNSGKTHVKIRKDNPNPGVPAYERVPGQESTQTDLEYLKYLIDADAASSGVTELQRGNPSDMSETLGQDQMLQSRAGVQMSWSEKRAIDFDIMTYAKVLHIAARFDRSPCILNVKGKQVPINDPGAPSSMIANAAPQGFGKIVISSEQLRSADTEVESQKRLLALRELQPLIQMGTVDPRWYSEEVVKALGDDPKMALVQPQELPLDTQAGVVPIGAQIQP